MLQDFGDLREPGADEAHQQAGDGDKDDGAQADEAVRFGGDVKDGGELIHQGDDPHRQIGEPDAAVLVIGEQIFPPEQKDKENYQAQIEDGQDDGFHESRVLCCLTKLQAGENHNLAINRYKA